MFVGERVVFPSFEEGTVRPPNKCHVTLIRRSGGGQTLSCNRRLTPLEAVPIALVLRARLDRRGHPSSKAELSKLSSQASGVRLRDWYKNTGCRFAQPGANILQPSGLRFARRRRARKLVRGERAKASPGR